MLYGLKIDVFKRGTYMDCKEVQKKFIPFMDDKLSIRELEAFLKHIDECEACRAEYDVYYTMIMGMRYLENDNNDNKTELIFDSEEKLQSAQEYLIKYKILYLEKIILLLLFGIGVIIMC